MCVCVCVCVCVRKRGEVLGVNCKVSGGRFRCSLEAGDEEAVQDSNTIKQTKQKRIIPL